MLRRDDHPLAGTRSFSSRLLSPMTIPRDS